MSRQTMPSRTSNIVLNGAFPCALKRPSIGQGRPAQARHDLQIVAGQASPQVNSAFAEHFPKNPPARMTMRVPLPKGLLISIGCVAVVENWE
jgi:hypothetical protein